jgi:hypothetical protein
MNTSVVGQATQTGGIRAGAQKAVASRRLFKTAEPNFAVERLAFGSSSVHFQSGGRISLLEVS